MEPPKIYDAVKEESDLIHQQLIKYNVSKIPFKPEQPFFQINRCIKNKNGGEIVGGILAEIYWGILSIDILWVKEEYRNKGYASALLTDVENTAK